LFCFFYETTELTKHAYYFPFLSNPGLAGFEPATSGFGDRRSSQLELQASKLSTTECRSELLLFPMNDMLAAEHAKLAAFKPVRICLLVFAHRVVFALTLGAR
jgi:hypothetical protein